MSGTVIPNLFSKFGTILFAALFIAIAIGSQSGLFQWDAEVYYAAGKAWRQGSNPYDLFLMPKTTGKQVLPFLYPPTLLPLAGLLSLLPLKLFHLIFLTTKIAALWLLVKCWRRLQLAFEITPFFILTAFGGASICDFTAGNTAVFETLLIWLALEAWILNKNLKFIVLIILAAQFKLLPIVLLALSLLDEPASKKQAMAGIALFLVFLIGAFRATPDLWRAFFTAASAIDERGIQNPCMAAFWRDCTAAPIGNFDLHPWFFTHMTMCAMLLYVSSQNIFNCSSASRESRKDAVFVAVLIYALSALRFKPYSYMLLIPAAAYAFIYINQYKSIRYIFLCFGLMPFLPLTAEAPIPIAYSSAFWTLFFWACITQKPPETPQRCAGISDKAAV